MIGENPEKTLVRSPLLPLLDLYPANGFSRILKKAKECGAKSASPVLLRLPGHVKNVFMTRIRQSFPLSAEKILGRIRNVRQGKLTNSNFGERFHGSGPYWENVQKMFFMTCEKLGLNQDELEPGRPPFHRPSLQKELTLF